MTLINDLRRLLLFQRLNLNYECIPCRRKFASRKEQLNHLEMVHLNQKKKNGDYKCRKCDKLFANQQIYRLHAQIHRLSVVSPIQERIRKQKNQLNEIEKTITAITNPINETSAKRKVGLTKVKMEDCLRCDACSCIYMDKNDYYKHMRNFHKITDVDTLKPSSGPCQFMLIDKPNNSLAAQREKGQFRGCKPRKKKQSLCHSNQQLPNSGSHIGDHSPLFRSTIKDIIKDRWIQMISGSMKDLQEVKIEADPESNRNGLQKVNIKPDPDADSDPDLFHQDYMTHLLSQVEVKIETDTADER